MAIILMLGAFLSGAVLTSEAQTICTVQDEACVLDTIWDAAERLPYDKQSRLKPNMMQLADATQDQNLIASWSRRLGVSKFSQSAATDYAGQKASQAIKDYGWDGFVRRARSRQTPFHIGRPEVMAAGVRLSDSAQRAEQIMDLMEELAVPNVSVGGGGDTFEQSDFGHALAELSMERCDLQRFDTSLELMSVSDNLRYDLWRARITGFATTALQRISSDADVDDTRHVRQAIEGYEAIVRNGLCFTQGSGASTLREPTPVQAKERVIINETPVQTAPVNSEIETSPTPVPQQNAEPIPESTKTKKKPWYKFW